MNGDCLAEQLKEVMSSEDFIVFREALIDGPIEAESSNQFWALRSNFIMESYGASSKEYYTKTVAEFDKLKALPDGSEICLWFENDLFCQANMWFIISMLYQYTSFQIYRIFPIISNPADKWTGFSNATPSSLMNAYDKKVKFTKDDLLLGKNLWDVYRKNDLAKLMTLSEQASPCFELLNEVCKAHADRFSFNGIMGRPERVIKEIMEDKSLDFQAVFDIFSKQNGIYGFGDLQVKKMMGQFL